MSIDTKLSSVSDNAKKLFFCCYIRRIAGKQNSIDFNISYLYTFYLNSIFLIIHYDIFSVPQFFGKDAFWFSMNYKHKLIEIFSVRHENNKN